jgi:pyrroloquinoline quinone biosynthesis protein B
LKNELAICDAEGNVTGVIIESFPVAGKIALYLEDGGG